MREFFDVVIIGAGVAGLSALLAIDDSQRVAVINPGSPLDTGSTWRAQGGVAVALGNDDSPELHAADTMVASRHLAEPRAVQTLTQEGPDRVTELLDRGLDVDRDADGETLFGLEAAHCRARVIHQKDHTGKALIGHLWERAKACRYASFFSQRATRLLLHNSAIGGVLLADGTLLDTPRVILASGGFAGLFEASTTGREVRGEGIVLAADVGARVRDLEFVQFHPTALDIATDGPLPLLTEALRGGGAKLRLESGERFVEELRPRDEVARAIASMRQKGHTVYLDLKPVERLAERFPGAYAHLTGSLRGKELLLPVRPAAHYTIGGVVTGLDGQTTVSGLYAAGEVASVGIHGANRLASNSLLEGLVFGHRAGRHAATSLRVWAPAPEGRPMVRMDEGPELALFRRLFEEATGVVRTSTGLARFLDWLNDQPVSVETILGRMVAESALARSESVGAHFRSDSSSSKIHVAG
jgi:L-aspartate oxidase